MSGLVAHADNPAAVIVALHGGASTAAYFDCPGHPQLSLLRAGPARGITVVALDRPGYGSSAPYPEAMHQPDQRVALAYGAVDKVLGQNPRGEGLFLLGHSAGCELAVRMAADDRAAQAGVLGLGLAGTGLRYADSAAQILKTTTATRRPVGLRDLLWEPADLYPPEVLSGITNSSTGAPYEADMTKNWPRRDFPAMAARVEVPVQFTVAEHERVWRTDPESLADIAAVFTAAPRFVLNEQAGAGHNISLSYAAADYHDKVLSFVEECVAARRGAEDKAEQKVEAD
ncbi:thioesterase [Mycolicibacterium acapulense]|nr:MULTISPECIES: alpha/beta hydrolase [Mycobacteriaceae]KUH97173.1 thioesterase [Mycolicibacterium acapulense]MCV7027298.1 alpha/beta hydrolase [Mycolicibacterium novocastrense]OBB71977.1 thioesterase [Mycobacterium sp. 852014-52144_SCH5372336]UUO04018.1 alpha/beta hydrolase [Mycolicibacterium novocastrense]UUO04019.1 alpha/beta hydrolase [Mycolicibacterium novocastrense]